MPKYYDELDAVLRALADPTRRAVVERLAASPAVVSELAAPFAMALPSLMLTALQYAVAAAVSAGASALEAAAVVTEASTVDDAGLAAVRDLAPRAPVHLAAPDGTLLRTVSGAG